MDREQGVAPKRMRLEDEGESSTSNNDGPVYANPSHNYQQVNVDPSNNEQQVNVAVDPSNNDQPVNADLSAALSISDIPSEIMSRMFSFLTPRELLTVGAVNRHFRSGAIPAWNYFKAVDLAVIRKDMAPKNAEALHSILEMLSTRSPHLESISGFSAFGPQLDMITFGHLGKFRQLQSVEFRRCFVELLHLVRFLSSTAKLDELRMLCCDIYLGEAIGHSSEVEIEEITEGGTVPSLKLKSLTYVDNNAVHLLPLLDVSALESLTLDNVKGEFHQQLLNRCTQLKEFRADMKTSVGWSIENALGTMPSRNLQLESLHLRRLPGNIQAVCNAAENWGRIRRITFDDCYITDDILHVIAASCPFLEHLTIIFLFGITTVGVQVLLDRCDKLVRLQHKFCIGIAWDDLVLRHDTHIEQMGPDTPSIRWD